MNWRQRFAFLITVLAVLAIAIYLLYKYAYGAFSKVFGWTGLLQIPQVNYPTQARIIYAPTDQAAGQLLLASFADAVNDPTTDQSTNPPDAATVNCIYVGGGVSTNLSGIPNIPTVQGNGITGPGVYAGGKRCQLSATRTNGTIVVALFGYDANDTYNAVKDFIEYNKA